MAAPSYTEDLTDITLSEAITGYTALGGGASGLGVGADFAVQGTNAVDKQITGITVKGMIYDNGTTITNSAGKHFFIWLFPATPGTMTSNATGGLRATLGTSTTAYMDFYLHGNDTLQKGGARCYPIRYTTTTTARRVATGAPGANPQWFGGQMSTNATVKGSNFGIDPIRHGTGAYITQGDSTTSASFNGFAEQNDLRANQWGILTLEDGIFKLQGRFVIGQHNTLITTASYFKDSNKTITLTDTEHSETDFTQIIVDHPLTFFNINNISIISLGTNNPGKLVFNNASTTGSLTSCNFNKLGTTTLRGNVSVTGTTWRTCDNVTQNGAVISTSIFTNSTSTSSLTCNNPGLVSNCEFASDGTNHALEVVSTGSYSFSGNKFTGYASSTGSTGNEVIYNNSGGTLTLNVAGGSGIISYRNGAGSTTVINNTIDVTVIGLKDNTEIRVFSSGTTTELAGIENATEGTVNNRSFTFSLSAGTLVDIVVINVTYENERIEGYTVPSSAGSIPVQQRFDRNYTNPT